MLSSLFQLTYAGWLFFAIDLLIRIWMTARVIQRRLPSGVAWAWICLILFLPLFGTILYLTFGEYRQARRRVERLNKANAIVSRLAGAQRETTAVEGPFSDLATAFRALCGFPVLSGNRIQLLPDAERGFESLQRDVVGARSSIDLEFYIWSDGGRADEFGEALCAAARRGVRCRLLVDALGSAAFVRGAMFRTLKDAGVEVVVALPSGLWRSLFARPDLRIHRKIAIIDGTVAYTGSMNLADPKFFKLDSGVAPWVDALARVEGPIVTELAAVFLSDWCAETGLDFALALERAWPKRKSWAGGAILQCLPSGPAVKNSAIEQTLLMAIAAARREVVLTTPYFLPSEALLFALTAAARRGVRAILIVPAKVDSRLTQHASRSFFEDLLAAGVEIHLYQKGLLHTKSLTVDGQLSFFGSLNLDPRSLRINFEITLAVYDETFTRELHELQLNYMRASEAYSLADFARRGSTEVWAGDLARLVGPLL